MNDQTSSGLCLRSVTIRLHEHVLLQLDDAVANGEILTVMGESGSGKSTLLDFVAGFLAPPFKATGRLILNGIDITAYPPQARRVGLMFQTPLLFPHMSVAGNLLFALKARRGTAQERQSTVDQALDEIGLAGFGPRDPATLSGGQQTRVALMRLLLAEPRALLLDEPFSSLDRPRRADIRKMVFETTRQRNLPVLLVTHDPEDAGAAGGRVVTL